MQVCHHPGVGRLYHGHGQIIIFQCQWEHHMFLGHLKGQDFSCRGIRFDFRKPDHIIIIKPAQHTDDGVRINISFGQENGTEPLTGFFLNFQGFVQLKTGDLSFLGKNFADPGFAGPGLVFDGGGETGFAFCK